MAFKAFVALAVVVQPEPEVPGVSLVWDKAEHALSWTVLTGAGLVLSTKRHWAIGLFALVFGAAVEVLQATMGLGRDGNWPDLVADGVGIAAAYLVWALMRRLGWVR